MHVCVYVYMCLFVYMYVGTCGKGCGYEGICVWNPVDMWCTCGCLYVRVAMCMGECVSVCAVGSWTVDLGASPLL